MNDTDKKISCVICAYNEASRIGAVLKPLTNHPLVDEIIVVDDGSTDGTSEVVKKFPFVNLVSYSPNKGKSNALKTGVKASKNNLLMFLDADLKNLTEKNISDLAEPVLSGKVEMTISIRKNSLLLYKLIGLDFVSGERVLPRKIVEMSLERPTELPPFGIEVYMNEKIIDNKLRIKIVNFKNVINTRKTEKYGTIKGILKDYGTVLDVLKVISPLKAARQNFKMISLSKTLQE